MDLYLENGCITERYSVERGRGSILVRVVLDGENGGPCDIIYIDPRAARPIAIALLGMDDPPIYDEAQNVIRFPGVVQ